MTKASPKTRAQKERGMALLLTLFALLLLSGIGLFMVLSSNTETRIDANYGSSMRAYYAANSGLEEVRDRIKYLSTSTTVTGGLADLLPQDIAGNAGGVLYIVNPANGETVDPTDVTSPYFDDDLCHTYNSGIPKGVKCAGVPTTANWEITPSIFSQVPATGPLGYKWIRVNMKTNRIAAPYLVDQGSSGAPLDTRVCWDGQAEQLLPNNGNPTCDGNGMQTVYMLTAMAVTSQATGVNGARKMLQAEVVAPSIRPAGVLTASSMTLPTAVGSGVPPVAIDGRIHNLDGSLFAAVNPDGTPATKLGCSPVAPLATTGGSSQMETALDLLRKSIVDTANSSCNADGTPANSCTPGLWWVRGTDTAFRFVTSVPTGTTGTTGGSGSSPGGSGSDGDGGGDHHGHHPVGVPNTTLCDPTNPSCYTNLDLSAPELFGIASTPGLDLPIITVTNNRPAPFVGNSGNQVDSTIYQPSATQTVPNQIAAINSLETAAQNKGNYFTPTSSTLNSSYGSSTVPAVVVFSDPTSPSLSLQNHATLTGFGLLVVNSLDIDSTSTLNWNGIVLVNSSTGHATINPGAQGFINGALLLAPGAVFTVGNGSSSGIPFQIQYSCDAIDLAFSPLPVKVVSKAEASF